MADSSKPEDPVSLAPASTVNTDASPRSGDSIEQKDFAAASNTREENNAVAATSRQEQPSREGTPPPLPPRPKNLQLLDGRPPTSGSMRSPRPPLQSKATTQLSFADTQSYSDEAKDTMSTETGRLKSFTSLGKDRSGSEAGDSASILSFEPTLEIGGDAESLLGEVLGDQERGVMKVLGNQFDGMSGYSDIIFSEDPQFAEAFTHEFDEIDDMAADGSNEGQRIFRFLGASADFFSLYRSYSTSMEIEVEAFPHLIFSREANLQPPWR